MSIGMFFERPWYRPHIYNSLSLSLSRSRPLRFNGHFPGEPGLTGVY